ncbi:GH25 family lysozyme [Levilactobacillus andaensis]|uniref:GH25 family lysozyme n=1 Tax=Levilactobacillus andaensis TaxID=2799570 RepID=UPI001943F4E9|nr:GH25 family lysozyme [Levilactobacillus andaensis]
MKRSDYQPIYENTFHRHHRRRWWALCALIIVLLVAGFGWFQWQAHQKQQLANYPVRGVIVNQDSGYLDFQQLAKHHQFVYLQATSGATYTDDDFSDNYSRSQGADIKVGVMHTFSFTTTAQHQFEHVVETVGTDSGSLPLAINVSYYGDYNSGNTTMAAQGQKLKRLVDLLQQHYQQGIVVLANRQVLNQFVKPVLPQQDYWIAGGHLVGHAAQIRFIEYDANASITQDGQEHAVAVSVFNGTHQAWTKYTE